MADLSLEDKAKGKRIITQFFRTMPGVQKTLTTIFERDGYEGIHRLQRILYPDNSTKVDSIDSLRKTLSMILQHIYGMPVEDKEGYFLDISKCKTASQVLRKEKETLVNHFYAELPKVKEALLHEMLEDVNFSFMSFLCRKMIGEEEHVSDMRSFKNQIRVLQETIFEHVRAGNSEDTFVSQLSEFKSEFKKQQGQPSSAAEEGMEGSSEKQRVIQDVLNEKKYHGLRDFLIRTTRNDTNFSVFQQYLDNVMPPDARHISKDMNSFSEGVKKLKQFRDELEQELA
ncbi:hypothetical protein CSB45_07655 [candidate division KSB3 bacterium]|uniref:Uncharacterized protein n=1 Tax=candidate division KSB3 bacterium TaxID=2044937 RepID=A0A2G6E5N6_9BACT|nr:MAG: hypothetical protein CSB45_07655 [candidate division KSB3 bacterium]PIE29909.1 MAG: hypothetical protein CSA57_06360 [candidate division KSB3 bacterium]